MNLLLGLFVPQCFKDGTVYVAANPIFTVNNYSYYSSHHFAMNILRIFNGHLSLAI